MKFLQFLLLLHTYKQQLFRLSVLSEIVIEINNKKKLLVY